VPPPDRGPGVPTVLKRVAESSNYVVAPAQELIGGRWCHVLEYPGHDRIWLDGERQGAMVAREMYDARTGALVQRIELGGLHEAAPGIWVPADLHNMLFEQRVTATAATELAPIINAHLHVVDARVNDDVPDALFDFRPRPGSVEVQMNKNFAQSVPGGLDYFDDLAGWIKRRVSYEPVPPRSAALPVEVIVEWMVSGVCLSVAAVLHWRRYRTGLGATSAPAASSESITVTEPQT
jgi:hypothetical protein